MRFVISMLDAFVVGIPLLVWLWFVYLRFGVSLYVVYCLPSAGFVSVTVVLLPRFVQVFGFSFAVVCIVFLVGLFSCVGFGCL